MKNERPKPKFQMGPHWADELTPATPINMIKDGNQVSIDFGLLRLVSEHYRLIDQPRFQRQMNLIVNAVGPFQHPGLTVKGLGRVSVRRRDAEHRVSVFWPLLGPMAMRRGQEEKTDSTPVTSEIWMATS